jgi:hypothetical protein
MWLIANCKNGVSSYEIHRAKWRPWPKNVGALDPPTAQGEKLHRLIASREKDFSANRQQKCFT